MKEYHDSAENRFYDEIRVDIVNMKNKKIRTVTWENVGTLDFETPEEALAFFAALKNMKSYHIKERNKSNDISRSN